MSKETIKTNWVRAHCYSCDWDGYTNDLDDACYGCGEYESLKEIPRGEDEATDEQILTMFD